MVLENLKDENTVVMVFEKGFTYRVQEKIIKPFIYHTIRKLGENERFIKPIKECVKRNLDFKNLAKTCAYILKFDAKTINKLLNYKLY